MCLVCFSRQVGSHVCLVSLCGMSVPRTTGCAAGVVGGCALHCLPSRVEMFVAVCNTCC